MAAAAAAAATPAPGSTDLVAMLRTLRPALDPDVYVFCTFPPGSKLPADLAPKLLFEETEGTTVVTTEAAALRAGVDKTKTFFPSRMVTISVHSSLDAVGLLAAITTHLAREVGVGVNPVSAFYHDHLFVPLGREDEVVKSLENLARQSEAAAAQAEAAR